MYHLQAEQNAIQKQLPQVVFVLNAIVFSDCFFCKWHFVLPEDGTIVPKHVGDANLMLLLTGNVHLLGATNGAVCYGYARN